MYLIVPRSFIVFIFISCIIKAIVLDLEVFCAFVIIAIRKLFRCIAGSMVKLLCCLILFVIREMKDLM